jgi:hypothetical protein
VLTWELSDGTTVAHTGNQMAVYGASAAASELRALGRSKLTMVSSGLPPCSKERFDQRDPLHVHELVTMVARFADVSVLLAPDLEWPSASPGPVPGLVY